MADIEFRSAEMAGVRFADRIIELIVAPYESEAVVPHEGRMIREVFARGAFESIDPKKRRINGNRDHDQQRPFGKAVAIRDERDGLVAEMLVSPTPLGDESLQLAADGILDASAGFRVHGETWHDRRSLRRLTKVWLHHIALTPDPAYDAARVLAVRSASPPSILQPSAATPNLDIVRGWWLQAESARLFGE